MTDPQTGVKEDTERGDTSKTLRKRIVAALEYLSPYMLEEFKRELSQEYDLKIVETGQEALDEVRKGNVDALILGIAMGEEDGLETLTESMSIDSKVPTILYTNYVSYKDNFMAWAANEYVLIGEGVPYLKEKIAEVLSAKPK